MKKKIRFLLVWLFINLGLSCYPQGFYDNFTWSSFNGFNFLTGSKDQLVQGPCNAFAAAAAVEASYKVIYFKPGLNVDVSEYQLYSPCTAGDYMTIFDFLVNTGVVNESSLPWDPNCIFMNCGNYYFNTSWCTSPPNPNEKYKVAWHTINLGALNTSQIQDSILAEGPIWISISSSLIHGLDPTAGHALLLHGWKKTGGVLKWMFKDSWPGLATLDYEVSVDALNLPQLYNNSKCRPRILTSVQKYSWNSSTQTWNLVNDTKSCNADHDGDGYCFWGIGAKPCSHGIYSQQDFDDNDNTKGPLIQTGPCKGYATPLPFVTAPVGQMVIYGPPQSGNCSVSHTLNWSYFKNITGDQMDWTPYSGSTPTLYTGPDNNAPGAIGLYVYTEATGGCYNQTAILESKYYFYIPSGNFYLNYYYHMYGANMGTLKVKIQSYPNTAWVEKGVTKSGDKGNSWFSESINLSEFSGGYIKIRFEGITGYGETSDLAIQNISISQSSLKNLELTPVIKEVKEVKKEPLNLLDQMFTLYPNPTSSQLHITTKEPLEYTLYIYSISGDVVYTKKLNSSEVIDVTNLKKGEYITKIKYFAPTEKIFTQKIIIH